MDVRRKRMSESKMKDNFLTWFIGEKLVPFSAAFAQNKYVKSISQGSMGLMAVIMIGAIFNLLNSIPIDAWKSFLTVTGIGGFCTAVYNASMNYIGLFMALSVSYVTAVNFRHKDLAFSNSLLGVLSYLILLPTVVNDSGDTLINLNYLGSRGIFLAFIVAILVTVIHTSIVDRKVTIKMPAGVPEGVAGSFTALIPGAVIVIVMGIIRGLFALTPYGSVLDAVYSILQIPLARITGSLPGFIILVLLAQVLWFFGIHGSYTVLGVLYPIWFTYIADNTAALAAGQPIPHLWNVSMYDFACNGGAGCTLGLVLVMLLFARSKRYKTFAKLVVPPGIFNINEPVIYGMPLMMNFTFIIPFITVPILSLVLAWGCIRTGLMPAPAGIIGFNAMPIFIYGILQGSWKIGVYQIVATLMSMAIWYPFFKAADNQALQEEQNGSREDNQA